MGPTRLPYRAANTFVFAQFTQFRANIDPVFDIDFVFAFGYKRRWNYGKVYQVYIII